MEQLRKEECLIDIPALARISGHGSHSDDHSLRLPKLAESTEPQDAQRTPLAWSKTERLSSTRKWYNKTFDESGIRTHALSDQILSLAP